MTVHAWDRGLATQRRAAVPIAAPPAGGRIGGMPGRMLELQRLAGNRAVLRAIASVQRAPGDEKQATKPGPDVITGADKAAPPKVTGFVGLNPGATKEAAGLTKASKETVLTSFNDPAAEKKLQEDPAIGEFLAKDLGWGPSDAFRMLAAFAMLSEADPHLREQLADIMRWMNRAEKGQVILDRLVLSGHSDGVKLWGDAEPDAESAPGIMVIERDLGALGRIFPKAVGQVQDIMFSACFSINAVEIVKKIFPNLHSVWSYGGYSPSVQQGSLSHILAWDASTEGDKTPTTSDKRGSNAIWTREKGYIVGDPNKAAAGPLITEASRGLNELVKPYFKGEKEVDRAVLDRFYTVLQQLQAHPGVDKETKDRITTNTIPVTLRLRHWKQIAERFGRQFGAELKPAYDALGMSPPNWSSLTRVQLKHHLDAIDQALETHPAASSYKAVIENTLRKGLFKLDSKVIDESWI
jgi:hypothetical protein